MGNSTELDKFKGVYSLMLTPFDTEGAVDWAVYERYVDWQLGQGPAGLFAVCGTSEMKWLTLEERLELAGRAVRLAGQTPVVATANLSTGLGAQLEEVQRMADQGVAGIVLVPPDGLGQDQRRLQEHLATLTAAAPCPVFIYEWPQVAPYAIDASVYGELVRQAGVCGIKDTTCTMEGIRGKLEAAPTSIVYQANTPYMLDALQAGASGIMAITSAAAAKLVVRLWEEAGSVGSAARAQEIHAQLVWLDALLRSAYPLTAKVLASLRGMPIGITSRWPVTLASEVAKGVEVWHETAQRHGWLE